MSLITSLSKARVPAFGGGIGLGTNPAADRLGAGIAKAFDAVFNKDLYAAMAAGEAQDAEAKRSLIGAQTKQAEAATALSTAKADAERQRQELGTFPKRLHAAALQNGVPMHQLDEFTDFATTGNLASQYQQPVDGIGPVMPKPAYAEPSVGHKIFRTLGLTQDAMALGDNNVDNVAQAAGRYQDQDIEAQALDAARRGDDMALSRLNALRGKKEFTPFSAVGNTGRAVNQVTGQGTTFDQILAGLSDNSERAQAEQRFAAGRSSDAAAAQHRAGAEKTKLQTEYLQAAGTGAPGLPGAPGPKAGGTKPPTGYMWTVGEGGEAALKPIPGGPKDPANAAVKPMPPAAVKQQQEELDEIGTANGIDADLGALEKQIKDKKLMLGVISNLVNRGRNAVGMSNEQSRNLASFQATLERMRNDSLRLNKGTQTEGDAVRAWNELVANIGDEGVVLQRLGEIRQLNKRAADHRRLNIEVMRNNFGQPPLDMGGRFNVPAAVGNPTPAPKGGAAGVSTSNW